MEPVNYEQTMEARILHGSTMYPIHITTLPPTVLSEEARKIKKSQKQRYPHSSTWGSYVTMDEPSQWKNKRKKYKIMDKKY